MQSGLPWTIIRPGRLTDGPYTSYDLNTLLKNTSGSRQDVQLSLKDDLNGEASRIAVAGELCSGKHLLCQAGAASSVLLLAQPGSRLLFICRGHSTSISDW